jgi:integrase
MMATLKLCRANVGTRNEPRPCGRPIAANMRAACKDHATTLIPTGESGIYYRGGSYVVVTVHRGKQTKTFHPTIGLAREARGDRTGTERKPPAARTPFDEYALAWVDSCQGRTSRGFDADTRAGYKRALELYAIPHLGRTPLRDIDRRDIDDLITKMQCKGLSAASIAAYLAPVRAMFSDAVERGDIAANPALRMRINAKAGRDRDRDDAPAEKTLTRAELSALLDATPDRWRLLFELLKGTGVRISEALGLDWTDLAQRGESTTLRIERQWYRGKLKPNAKTEAGERTIALDAGLAARLWAAGADSTGPMFATRTGQRLNDRNLRRVLDSAAARAGVVGVSFHTFRHTHGSMLLEAGWTIPQVSKRLGHADPAITARVYSHAMRDTEPDLSFLSGLGNGWAHEGAQTAANVVSLGSAETSA